MNAKTPRRQEFNPNFLASWRSNFLFISAQKKGPVLAVTPAPNQAARA